MCENKNQGTHCPNLKQILQVTPLYPKSKWVHICGSETHQQLLMESCVPLVDVGKTIKNKNTALRALNSTQALCFMVLCVAAVVVVAAAAAGGV